MKETPAIARGMVPLVNGEAARCGEAVQALNVREHEQSLQVTGVPAIAGEIAPGERLLLLAGGYRVTCDGQTVKINGTAVAVMPGAVSGAHAIGDVIVVVAGGAMRYLVQHGGQWVALDPADAVPQLSIGVNAATERADIDALEFSEPYSRWEAPLASADTSELAARLRSAWDALSADAAAEGYYTSPVLVRWAVRLKDDSYLWMSDPVRVGDVTLANADRIAAMVTTSSSRFTGIEASVMTMVRYGLDIRVTRGIGAAWLPLVAAIDVLVTDEARLLASNRSLDYRCLTRTTAGREYVLEMGLSRRSAAAVASQLASSPWHLVATAAVGPQITGSDFVAPLEPLTLSNAECHAVGAMMRLDHVVCSTSAGGRLYCCTSSGDVVVSVAGNALVEAHRRSVLGAVPLALAVVTRPLYSGGFGRYPVYVFTDDGIYTVPQSATGTLGEARLVDRTVIKDGVAPVEAGRDIWLVSRHGHLCCLSGARLDVCLRDVDCIALAWCNAHSELWLLRGTGNPVVMMPGGRLSERTLAAVQLYSDPRHAVAVDAAGNLLDLERETAATVPVAWLSHPVGLNALLGVAVRRVVWHVSSDAASLTLKVIGQRGIMAQDSDVSVTTVAGAVNQPLASAPVAMRARTIRLSVTGEAVTGTLLLPTLIYSM